MAVHDFNAQRLWVEAPLAPGTEIAASSEQVNYLLNVLRMKAGDEILLCNGLDGEWRARLEIPGKRRANLVVTQQTRAQTPPLPLVYMFAPLKRARLDYMVQKAVEMGAGRLVPVLTRRTQAERVNLERMRANAVEAVEQCGILSLPEIEAPVPLAVALERWPAGAPLIFCDESTEVASPLAALEAVRAAMAGRTPAAGGVAPGADYGRHGVLIGPEGGFDPAERELLLSRPFVTAISLGPRIMRADTAAVASLALVNAVLGDWR